MVENIVGDDPTMELSRLDQEDKTVHAKYGFDGLGTGKTGTGPF
ncbi:hypothetical protein [Arthrobacter sp. D3-16]